MIKISKEFYFLTNSDTYYSDEQKYYKNNEELTKNNDDSGPISIDEFKQIISSSLHDSIDYNFNNIVVLLGAGASVVSKEDFSIDTRYGKTMLMLYGYVEKALSQNNYDMKKHEPVSSNSSSSVLTIYSIPQLIDIINKNSKLKIKKDEKNLENFISKLSMYNKLIYDETVDNSLKVIRDIIKINTKYSYDSKKFKHGALLNILSNHLDSSSKLNMVTTNYDTVIEESAEKNNFTVFDGFSFSQQSVFNDDNFEWNLVKNVNKLNTNEKIYKKKTMNLLKLHGSLTWMEVNDGKDESVIYRKSKDKIKTPVMIFPSSDKYMHSYEEPYFELFSRFQNLLKKPQTLFITAGFSFADNHISRMIIEAIKHNESLSTLITNYSIQFDNKNIKEINDLRNNQFPISFLKASLNGDLTDYLK